MIYCAVIDDFTTGGVTRHTVRQAVDEMIARVEAWRAVNPDKLKTPDVHPGEIVT